MQNHKKPEIKISYNDAYEPVINAHNLTQQDACVLIGKLQVLAKTLPRQRKMKTGKRFVKAVKYAFAKTPVDRQPRYCKG